MSDISITITSDPQQAINGIAQVRKEADKLIETQRRVQEASDAAATDALNSVGSVSREVAQSVSEAGAGLDAISSGIHTAGAEASKVAGAFGQSLPVIGRLGSAISSALTGPVAAVSAAIGVAITQITKMIAEAESRVQRLRSSAGTQASSAYDAVLQGRAQYAQDLQTLAQVRQIQSIARQSALDAAQLKKFRKLAAQIGIEARDVTATGIKSGRIDEAEKSLRQQRRFYAQREYQDYESALAAQLQREIEASKLNSATKKNLSGKSLPDLVASITSRARSGYGWTLEEYQMYQDLYALVKPFTEIQASYARDKMLGRSQAELNAAAMASITGARHTSASGTPGAAGATGAPEPGTWAWQQEQDKLAMKAAEEEAQEQKHRTEAARRLTEGLERQIRIQQLITDGKEREAFILRNRLSLEDAYGRVLTDAEAAENARLASTLYDLQHPVIPQAEPEAASTATRAASQSASLHLDRLQRLGANAARAAVSPEKLVMDKQLSVQESIRNILASALVNHPDTSIMRF